MILSMKLPRPCCTKEMHATVLGAGGSLVKGEGLESSGVEGPMQFSFRAVLGLSEARLT